MLLYVECQTTKKRVYLEYKITSRSELPKVFEIQCPYDNQLHIYHRQNVIAIAGGKKQAGFAALGGLIGLLGGAPGLIIGGLIGAIVGDKIDNEDIRLAERFNQEQS